MDRFNSFASQAKAKAEQGRTALNSQLNKTDRPGSTASPPPFASYSANRHSPSSSTTSAFVGISASEKEAFMSLLDEYFDSRPQYRDLFAQAPARAYAAATSAPAPAPPPVRHRGLGTATALYDYAGGESEDLSLSEGDKIVILEHVSDEWWKGEQNGREGIFPSSYVQMDA